MLPIESMLHFIDAIFNNCEEKLALKILREAIGEFEPFQQELSEFTDDEILSVKKMLGDAKPNSMIDDEMDLRMLLNADETTDDLPALNGGGGGATGATDGAVCG